MNLRGEGDTNTSAAPTSNKTDRTHLDDAVFLGVRVQRVLDIALADDSEMPNDIHSRRPQHIVILIRQSLRRRNDDRVARMDAQRIEIL